MTDATRVTLTVNGAEQALRTPAGGRLIDVLRDGLRLTGTKEGCDDGTCGTCTVLLDGRMVRACRVGADEAAGREVVTIEGLGTPDRPHRLQEAFVAADAVQCGFCTPGLVMAAAALLERNPAPDRAQVERWLGSNLCRCTGYHAIVDAILWAAGGSEGPPRQWPTPTGPGAAATETRPGIGADVRPDALAKATGRAVYAADLAVPGMLHARALRSPHPHADIECIDVARARALPGVVAILTVDDIPGARTYGRKLKDQPVLAESRVRQVGDPVALVVAESAAAAAAALEAIEVTYRPLPAFLSPEAALADGAPPIHPGGNLLAEHRLRTGDVAAALAGADIVVEETYATTWNEHAYLEPEAALAEWDGETLIVRTPTQYTHYQQAEIARVLGLPKDRVRLAPTVVGGAFGGKTEISCQCLAAVAAYRTGRPVKIVYSRAESFATTTKRHPFRMRVRAGATREGDLVALEMDILGDTGAYASFGGGVLVKSFASAAGPYRWQAVDLHGRIVLTNNPTAGAMRGPGTTQVAFALEAHLDLLATRLRIDPLELRRRNRLRAGDRVLSGQVLGRDIAYDATIDAIRPHWEEARGRLAAARGGVAAAGLDGTRRRGVGVASVWYGIGGGGGGPVPGQDPALTVGRGPGRAELDLREDGTVRVRTGAMDLGQGSAAVMRLLAAEELGLAPEQVIVEFGDTATNPDAGPSVGSRVTFFVGNAVRSAAADLREAVLGTAAGLLERPVRELELRGGRVAVRGSDESVTLDIVARARAEARRALTFEGYFDAGVPAYDPAGGLGEPYAMYVTGTQMAEVEVDTATGDVRVLRVVAAHDVGHPVFPAGLVGQVEGGIAMGIGFALTEAFVPGVTEGFREYRIPRTRDMPEIVTILVGGTGEESPELRLKGIAECSNMVVAPAIVNAIADAIGRRVTDLPVALSAATPQATREAST